MNSSFIINSVLKLLLKADILFPLIAKPDIGFRGYLVKKINSQTDLENYLKNNSIAIILQEYVGYEKEIGLFYYKIPGETKGKITSITLKKFITVTGNGVDNKGIFRNENARLKLDNIGAARLNLEKSYKLGQQDILVTNNISYIKTHHNLTARVDLNKLLQDNSKCL